MKVNLVCIATRKYTTYIPQFLDSAFKYFFPDDDVHITIFTDKPEMSEPWYLDSPYHGRFCTIEIPSYGFPEATMLRYHIFSNNDLSGFDYTFYADIDSKFVDYVGKDDTLADLMNTEEKYFVTKHPGFWRGGIGSWETRPESLSYVPEYHRSLFYVAGGFLGARTSDFLNLAGVCSELMRGDLRKGITACWHDESALNKFVSCIDTPQIYLPSEYVWPEGCDWFKPHPSWKPRIVALKKNHAEMRS